MVWRPLSEPSTTRRDHQRADHCERRFGASGIDNAKNARRIYAAPLGLHIESPNIVNDHRTDIFEDFEVDAERAYESNAHRVIA